MFNRQPHDSDWHRRAYLTACLWITLGAVIWLLAACSTPTPDHPPTQAVVPLKTLTRRSPQTPTLLATPTSTPLPPTSTLPVQAAELKGIQVEFWYVIDALLAADVDALIDEFNQSNAYGIRVQGLALDSQGRLEDRFRQGQAEGTLPDLMAGYTELVLRWDAGAVEIVDLARYIGDPAWGLAPEAIGDFYASVWSREVLSLTVQLPAGWSVSRTRVGLPWYRTGLVLIYNQSWAKQLGFSQSPSTPDEFRQQACAAAQANLRDIDRENDGSGGWLASSDASTLLSWIFAFNGQITPEHGRGYRFDSPESLAALQFIHTLADQGCAWLLESEAPPDPIQEFVARKALFTAVSLPDLASVQAALSAAESADEWGVLPFPSPDGPAALDIYGPSLILLRSSDKKQLAAWLFARWLATPEVQADWVASSGSFPTRASVLPLLEKQPGFLPQWRAALKWMPIAHVEPAYASWSAVRWALQDVIRPLFNPEFQPAEARVLLELLDRLASELQAQVR